MRRALIKFAVFVGIAAAAGLVLALAWDPPCPKDLRTLKQWLRAVGREECLSAERACRELTFERLASGMNRSDRRILGMFTLPGGSDARALASLVGTFRESYGCPASGGRAWAEQAGERLRLLVLREGFVLAGESGRHAFVPNIAPTGHPDFSSLERALASVRARFPDESRLTVFPGKLARLDVVLIASRLAGEVAAPFEITTVFCAGEPDEGGCPEWQETR
ncbi:MAG: hypothetical protein ACOX6T_16095 [Myxococcales bacterium]|jgi:hypothetical protein